MAYTFFHLSVKTISSFIAQAKDNDLLFYDNPSDNILSLLSVLPIMYPEFNHRFSLLSHHCGPRFHDKLCIGIGL